MSDKPDKIKWEDLVVIYDDEIRWDVKTRIIENGGEKVIELSYGWTAGMTPEEIANLDEDDQHLSHQYLLIDKLQALSLIEQLSQAIHKLEE